SRTGEWTTSDALARLLITAIRLRRAPDIDTAVSFLSVDFLARAMAILADREVVIGTVYEYPVGFVAFRDVIEELRALGEPIEVWPARRWQEEALFGTDDIRHRDVAPVIAFGAQPPSRPTVRSEAVNGLLAAGVELPSLQALLERYVSWFRSLGLA
ncbi:MAG: hypothetical protein ACREMY_29765, partial [bacterium]